ALLLLLAAGSAASDRVSIDRLAWLAGCWAVDGAEAGTVESWTQPSGGAMLATSVVMNNGRMTWFEFLRIVETDDGRLSLFPQPAGKPAIEFTLRSIRPGHVAFENGDNDFPQVIIYEKVSEQRIRARLTELTEENPRVVIVGMTRTEC
ncbi:MAG: DUF6265 family protein, partial [Woeseiaceae bacterium]|nr:DUF6265 family protein [Woeseiaceae bacterium]